MKQKLPISIAAYLISLGLLVGFLGVVGPAMAQDGAGATDSEGPVEGSRDPLSFRSSLEIKNKYVDVDGGNSNTTIFRGKHAFSGDFYVRLDMPVVGSHLPKRGGGLSRWMLASIPTEIHTAVVIPTRPVWAISC